MAEGGYDPEGLELREQLDRLAASASETPMETEDTSFTLDTNTQYNTGDNLNDDDYFDYTGIQPPVARGRSLEEITKDWETWGKKKE